MVDRYYCDENVSIVRDHAIELTAAETILSCMALVLRGIHAVHTDQSLCMMEAQGGPHQLGV